MRMPKNGRGSLIAIDNPIETSTAAVNTRATQRSHGGVRISGILDTVAASAPLRRNVTIDDVGNVAAFLLSDLAAGVTAEITYVDCGFSTAVSGIVE